MVWTMLAATKKCGYSFWPIHLFGSEWNRLQHLVFQLFVCVPAPGSKQLPKSHVQNSKRCPRSRGWGLQFVSLSSSARISAFLSALGSYCSSRLRGHRHRRVHRSVLKNSETTMAGNTMPQRPMTQASQGDRAISVGWPVSKGKRR